MLVVIDSYSRFPEVEIIHSSARATIPELNRIFTTHGIPRIIKSDNGPPFDSNELGTFMQENGIKHERITPLWPQANAQAEHFMMFAGTPLVFFSFPFTSDCIIFGNDNYILYLHIATAHMPFFLWNERWKDISYPSLPK